MKIIIIALIIGVALLPGCIEQTVITQYSTTGIYYGEVYYRNPNGVTLTMTEGQYYNLNYNTTTYNKGVYLRPDLSNITVNHTGLYDISFLSIGSGENNHEYILGLKVNDVGQQTTTTRRKMAAGGDIVTMAGHGILSLNAGDNVTMFIRDITSNGDGVYYKSNVNIKYLGAK